MSAQAAIHEAFAKAGQQLGEAGQIDDKSVDHLNLHMTIAAEIAQPFLEQQLAELGVVPKTEDERDVFQETVMDFADSMAYDFIKSITESRERSQAFKVFSDSANRNLKEAHNAMRQQGL